MPDLETWRRLALDLERGGIFPGKGKELRGRVRAACDDEQAEALAGETDT